MLLQCYAPVPVALFVVLLVALLAAYSLTNTYGICFTPCRCPASVWRSIASFETQRGRHDSPDTFVSFRSVLELGVIKNMFFGCKRAGEKCFWLQKPMKLILRNASLIACRIEGKRRVCDLNLDVENNSEKWTKQQFKIWVEEGWRGDCLLFTF